MTHFRHVGIVVRNLNEALQIWNQILGFQIISRKIESGPAIEKLIGINGVRLESVKLAAESKKEIVVELLTFSYPKVRRRHPICTPNTFGITHIALTVIDLPSILDSLQKYGVKLLGEISSSEDGRTRGIYTEFPENILIELVEVIH